MVSGIGWLTCEWLVVWVDVLCSTPTLCVKQPREMYQVVCGGVCVRVQFLWRWGNVYLIVVVAAPLCPTIIVVGRHM